ncbi:MAG: ThuA domain-containing protein [Armatimonadetes bacterium]|nr:ThuA domain-containing protein [Armatimonadota bacterium]
MGAPTDDELARIDDAAPATAPAKAQRPRALLVFTRNEGYNHTAIPYGAAAFAAMARKTGAFKVTESDDLAVFSPAGLKRYDAILFDNGFAFKLDPAQQQALWQFVEAGHGLIGIHAASANFDGWPAGTALFGALFHSHPWTPVADWPVRNDAPAHPLNAPFGGQGFRVRDEIYTFTQFHREAVQVLLSLDLSDPATGGVPHPHPFVPISWIHRVGKGRVFFCSLGHEHAIFWTPPILAHLLAGIQFALGDLPAPIVPDRDWPYRALRDGGPESARVALEGVTAQAIGDPARRAEVETKLLQLLRSPVNEDVKRGLFGPLSLVAGAASVPVAAGMLADPALSHGARLVLERVGTAEARAALREALSRTIGLLRAGVLSSLGALRDPAAVAALRAAVADPDPAVAGAALRALGAVGNVAAAEALLATTVPATLQTTLDAAQARCAERLLAAKQLAPARRLAEALTADGRSPQARVAGLDALVASGSSAAVGKALAALESAEPGLRVAAAGLAAKVGGKHATPRFAALLPKLAPEVQAALLTALGERGDRAAAPAAVALLQSGQPAVRLAAVRAAGRLAGAEAVEPLSGLDPGGSGELRLAIVEALDRLRGAGVVAALVRATEAGSATAFRSLVNHGGPEVVKALMAMAESPDRATALRALGGLASVGTADRILPLTRLLLGSADRGFRDEAVNALQTLVLRQPNRERALAPILAMHDHVPDADEADLIPIIAAGNGERSLALLQTAARSGKPLLVKAVIRGLAAWQDARPLPLLLELAKTAADKADRVQAVRVALGLLGKAADAHPAETVAGVGQVLAVAERPEERAQALTLLRDCRVSEAATLAAGFLGDETLRQPAIAAIFDLAAAQLRGGVTLPAVTGPALEAALGEARRARFAGLPQPWMADDLGSPGSAGTVAQADGTWAIKASGWDIWGGSDGGFFVFQPWEGDLTLTARVVSLAETDAWAKSGVMVREGLEPTSRYVSMFVSAHNPAPFQWRAAPAGASDCALSAGQPQAPYWVRLVRRGDRFTGYLSADGEQWTQSGDQTLALAARLQVGLGVTAHNNGAVTTSVIDHVTLDREAPASAQGALPMDKLRVAVVTGGHGFETGLFWAMWNALPGVGWREVQHPGANAIFDPMRRGEYDVVALYDMNQAVTDEEKAWLLDYVRSGGGLVVMHHALANYQAWPEFSRLAGAKYLLQPETIDGVAHEASTWREGVGYRVEVADHDDPITRGLADFDVHDEVYGKTWLAPDSHVLLKVSHPESAEAVMWTRTEGKGRVVGLLVGHGPGSWGVAEWRTALGRALAWAAQGA